MTDESLCLNCLRANSIHPTNQGRCEACNGDTCSCSMCLDTLFLLRQGIKDKAHLGLQVAIKDWSEIGGVVL